MASQSSPSHERKMGWQGIEEDWILSNDSCYNKNTGKRPMGRDTKPFVVEVSLSIALDVESSPWYKPRKSYTVVAWVESDPENIIEIVASKGWLNQQLQVELLIHVWEYRHEFLHVEVVRKGIFEDPGSSNGEKVVGRARVSLPDMLHEKTTALMQIVHVHENTRKPDLGFGARISMQMVVRQQWPIQYLD